MAQSQSLTNRMEDLQASINTKVISPIPGNSYVSGYPIEEKKDFYKKTYENHVKKYLKDFKSASENFDKSNNQVKAYVRFQEHLNAYNTLKDSFNSENEALIQVYKTALGTWVTNHDYGLIGGSKIWCDIEKLTLSHSAQLQTIKVKKMGGAETPMENLVLNDTGCNMIILNNDMTIEVSQNFSTNLASGWKQMYDHIFSNKGTYKNKIIILMSKDIRFDTIHTEGGISNEQFNQMMTWCNCTLTDQLKGNKKVFIMIGRIKENLSAKTCLLYTSPSPRDLSTSRMPSSA